MPTHDTLYIWKGMALFYKRDPRPHRRDMPSTMAIVLSQLFLNLGLHRDKQHPLVISRPHGTSLLCEKAVRKRSRVTARVAHGIMPIERGYNAVSSRKSRSDELDPDVERLASAIQGEINGRNNDNDDGIVKSNNGYHRSRRRKRDGNGSGVQLWSI